MNLLDLAARCEAATGPDSRLDNEISIATGETWVHGSPWLPYTASLDAAMTLVPEGYQFGCGSFGNPDSDGWAWCELKERLTDDFPYGKGVTPSLALCAAALKARAAQGDGK